MQYLTDAGLIVPDEIPSDDDTVPLDFTRMSNRDVGALHSRYAVRYSHAIFHCALAQTTLVKLKRDLKMAQAKFRVRHADEKKTIVDAMMEDDRRISKALDKIAIQEAHLTVLDAVASGYEALRNAASREISRRIGEKAALD